MTVEQLIEKLKDLPQDYDIALYNEFEGGYHHNFEIDVDNALKNVQLSC